MIFSYTPEFNSGVTRNSSSIAVGTSDVLKVVKIGLVNLRTLQPLCVSFNSESHEKIMRFFVYNTLRTIFCIQLSALIWSICIHKDIENMNVHPGLSTVDCTFIAANRFFTSSTLKMAERLSAIFVFIFPLLLSAWLPKQLNWVSTEYN